MGPWVVLHAPAAIVSLIRHGNVGVQVFFVISGFVIVHSLGGRRLDASALGWFALRRQLRLDPPYWTTVLAVLLLSVVRHLWYVHSPHSKPADLPSVATVLGNIFYLQKFTNCDDFIGVSWTLAIEIQFYVTAALTLWVCQWGKPLERLSRASVWTTCVTGIASAVWRMRSDSQALFTAYWCYFAAGALAYWSLQRQWVTAPVAILLAAMAATTAWSSSTSAGVTGVVTTALICVLGSKGRLATVTGGTLLKWAGRNSYSLYLVHLPIFAVVLGIGSHFIYDRASLVVAWYLVALAAVLSIGTVLNRLVEVPTIRLSHRLRRVSTPRRSSPMPT
jgi:peptidoglycan/LPS O-acetylase OafA/YrhL